MSPTVSVITPAYNADRFIAEAVNSVLEQTFADWELIIVNDGSTDRTADVLAQFEDPRIRVRHQKNAGTSAARNAALECATGRFVAFLDADDILPSESLARRVSYFDLHPEVEIVNGAVRVLTAQDQEHIYRPSCAIGPHFPRLARLDEAVFFGPNYMIRRDRIGAHRFPLDVTHSEDLIFFLNLAHDAELCYGAVPDVIYEYRKREGSAMSNIDGLESGYLDVLRRAARFRRLDDEGLAFLRKRISLIMVKTWLRRGRPGRAIRVVFSARRAAKRRPV